MNWKIADQSQVRETFMKKYPMMRAHDTHDMRRVLSGELIPVEFYYGKKYALLKPSQILQVEKIVTEIHRKRKLGRQAPVSDEQATFNAMERLVGREGIGDLVHKRVNFIAGEGLDYCPYARGE